METDVGERTSSKLFVRATDQDLDYIDHLNPIYHLDSIDHRDPTGHRVSIDDLDPICHEIICSI